MLFIKTVPQQENEEVQFVLKKLGFDRFTDLCPGEVNCYGLNAAEIKLIEDVLIKNGYNITSNKKEILSEKVKLVAAQMIDEKKMPVVNISRHISDELGNNYTYLSDIFSEINGLTIEHYIINYRINKAKEMMQNPAVFIREIAQRLHYKSVAHFSAQFKKVTGVTPSQYKEQLLQKNIRE